jgi:uroporphyrinogen-III synthase
LHILITRPVEDSGAFAAALRARGHACDIAPMLVIAPAPEAKGPLDLTGVQAILFTSANGVRAFAARSENLALPVFAVGEASAEAARAEGFAQVESAGGDVEDLTRLVAARLEPAQGALFHGAAREVAGDLKGALESHGFEVRREVLYEARAAEALSPGVRTSLMNGEIDAISFFSPRTAETFVALARAAGVTPALANCDALCLSVAVAEAVRVVSWRSVRVAARPNRDALLESIDRLAAEPAGERRDQPREGAMPADPPDNDKDGGAASAPANAAPEGPAQEIISLFGGIRPMANKLGVAVSTVQGWRERDSIPSARHEQIAAAADSHNIALDRARLADSDRHPDSPDGGHEDAQDDRDQDDGSRHAPEDGDAPKSENLWGATDTAEKEEESSNVPPPMPAMSGDARGGRPWLSAFLIAAAIFIAGAGAAVLTREAWAPIFGARDTRVEDIQARLDLLESGAAAARDTQAAIAKLRADLDAKLGELNARLDDSGAAPQAEVAAQRQQIESLRQQLDAVTARLDTVGELAAASGDSEQLAAALAKIEGRNAELAQEVQALRTELTSLAQSERAAPASQSAIALAVLQMRDALRGAEPFAPALQAVDAQLSGRGDAAAQDLRAALEPLRGFADTGAPSLDSLQAEFPALARRVIAQSHGGEGEDLLSNVLRRLSSLVSVRPVGPVEGDSVEAIVARAESHLNGGDLRAALETLDALSGPAAEAAAEWRARAEARLKAQDALAKLGALLAAQRAGEG